MIGRVTPAAGVPLVRRRCGRRPWRVLWPDSDTARPFGAHTQRCSSIRRMPAEPGKGVRHGPARFSFVGGFGGSGSFRHGRLWTGRLGAGGDASGRTGRRACAKRCIHPGFLRHMEPPLFPRLRTAGVRPWSGDESFAAARRAAKGRRRSQAAGRRLHQSDPEARGGGSRQEARRNGVKRRGRAGHRSPMPKATSCHLEIASSSAIQPCWSAITPIRS